MDVYKYGEWNLKNSINGEMHVYGLENRVLWAGCNL